MHTSRANRGIVAALMVASIAALGGCTSADEVGPTTSDAPTITTVTTVTTNEPTTTVGQTTTTTEVVPETLPLEDVPPLAIYLASIDRGLASTRYAGDVYVDPESFIATGRLFCSLLEAGVDPAGVLESYVATLQQESPTGEVDDDDDLILGGVVLGAAVKVICPEFAELIDVEPSEGSPPAP